MAHSEVWPGHAVPEFLVYCGRQPAASSSFSFGTLGSQSSDWFWLPPTTRSETTGSLTDDAYPRLPVMPT